MTKLISGVLMLLFSAWVLVPVTNHFRDTWVAASCVFAGVVMTVIGIVLVSIWLIDE